MSDPICSDPLLAPAGPKVRGRLFLNGNAVHERDLIEIVQPWVLAPEHFDPEIDDSRKVLLITAAWRRGHEHEERHVIESFESAGIPAGWQGRLPHNIQNLSVWTQFDRFKRKEPWLYRRYTEKQDLLKAVKADYQQKTYRYVEQVYDLTRRLEADYPTLQLHHLANLELYRQQPDWICPPDEDGRPDPACEELDRLAGSPRGRERCAELRRSIEHLRFKDAELFGLIGHLEQWFLDHSGVAGSALYREQRAELAGRIESSASVFLFGGHVFVLANRLRFYQLGEFLHQAVDRGTNVYGISAGSLVQTDRFALSFERSARKGFSGAADYGVGLVRGLWVIPHASDHAFVREAHPDTLSLFVIRQHNGVVVGLNENSVLMRETTRDPIDDQAYDRWVSVGSDPVLVFGPRGHLHQMQRGDELVLEGCKHWVGWPQMLRAAEVAELEARWQRQQLH